MFVAIIGNLFIVDKMWEFLLLNRSNADFVPGLLQLIIWAIYSLTTTANWLCCSEEKQAAVSVANLADVVMSVARL